MARIRTIPKAIEEIKGKDPGTSLSYGTLRRWVHEGRIKSFDGGKCKMVDLDDVERLVESGAYANNWPGAGGQKESW